MTPLQIAIERIQFSRKYTDRLLADLPTADWFRMPAEGITHIAWQVGHLAVAQYRLALVRLRGELPTDQSLMPTGFVEQFGKGSVAAPDPTQNPTIEEIRMVFENVHAQVLHEAPHFSESLLAETSLPRHSMFETKLGALAWCGNHEMVHAGQIALLRRLLGHNPLW